MSFNHRLMQRQFKPSLAATLATLVLLPILISLGFWQLRRADDKRALIAQYELGATTTQTLTADNIATLPLLQHVVLTGRYESSRQILLDNMPSTKDTAGNSHSGYHVLTPLWLNDHDIVLVDRGWLPLGRTRSDLPTITLPDAVTQTSLTLHGRVAELPRAGMHLAAAAATTWPQVMNFPTLSELQTLYTPDTTTQLLPRIVLLDASEEHGYERNWSTRYSVGEFGPERHIGYAVQWFGMAAALLIIYCVVNLRKSQ